jgi:fatty acid desaturase
MEKDRGRNRKEEAMTKLTLLALGVAAWAGVAGLSVLIAFNMGTKDQKLMFLPILVGVVAAWVIGEAVTERVFNGHEEGK